MFDDNNDKWYCRLIDEAYYTGSSLPRNRRFTSYPYIKVWGMCVKENILTNFMS